MRTPPVKRNAPTHFEQIPIEVVKRIAVLDEPGEKPTVTESSVALEPPARKSEPYSVPISALCYAVR